MKQNLLRRTALALVPLLVLALFFGCKKEEPAAPTTDVTTSEVFTFDYNPSELDTTTETTTEELTDPTLPTAAPVNAPSRTTTTQPTTKGDFWGFLTKPTTTKKTTTTKKPASTTKKPVATTTAPATTTKKPVPTTIPSGSDKATTTTAPTTITTAAPVKVSGVQFTGASSYTLDVGSTQQLAWTVLPGNASNKDVVFTSSSSAVATVSPSGVVKAIGEGTVVVTVLTTDKTADRNYSDTVTVTVEPIPVTRIEIYGSDTVKTDKSITLTAKLFGEGNKTPTNSGVIWSSGDASAATVNQNGVVTGVNVSDGVAITCTSKGNPAVSQTVEIRVTL
ncbi:MAG: Ig-like domain-containing protein [Oscillospiraceae bacterium]|jgi:uncharacterized protein YjdB|nr:Ig-like domain-containing protein [Oscillospiraceae bacterium]